MAAKRRAKKSKPAKIQRAPAGEDLAAGDKVVWNGQAYVKGEAGDLPGVVKGDVAKGGIAEIERPG